MDPILYGNLALKGEVLWSFDSLIFYYCLIPCSCLVDDIDAESFLLTLILLIVIGG